MRVTKNRSLKRFVEDGFVRFDAEYGTATLSGNSNGPGARLALWNQKSRNTWIKALRDLADVIEDYEEPEEEEDY
jgi:hypothetical protein